MPASCQPALAQLIKRCWAANPSKRPDFTYIVSALEKYDECVKEGLPMTLHSGLVNRNAILERLKGCVSMSSSSIPVNVWIFYHQSIIILSHLIYHSNCSITSYLYSVYIQLCSILFDVTLCWRNSNIIVNDLFLGPYV